MEAFILTTRFVTSQQENTEKHNAVVHQRASNITFSSFCSAHMELHQKKFVVRVVAAGEQRLSGGNQPAWLSWKGSQGRGWG